MFPHYRPDGRGHSLKPFQFFYLDLSQLPITAREIRNLYFAVRLFDLLFKGLMCKTQLCCKLHLLVTWQTGCLDLIKDNKVAFLQFLHLQALGEFHLYQLPPVWGWGQQATSRKLNES